MYVMKNKVEDGRNYALGKYLVKQILLLTRNVDKILSEPCLSMKFLERVRVLYMLVTSA